MQNKDYWFPWLPVKFRRKTIGLTRQQRHAYRDLIDWYMETGEALPNNQTALASICCLSSQEWKDFNIYSLVIAKPYFEVGDDGLLHNELCDHTLQYQIDKSTERSISGKIGADKRWLSHSLAIANDSTPHHTTSNHIINNPSIGTENFKEFDGRSWNGVEVLSDKVSQELLYILPSQNQQEILSKYIEWHTRSNKPFPDHPKGAFLAWAKLYAKGKIQ